MEIACESGDVGKVKELISVAGFDINSKVNNIHTAFQMACMWGHLELVKELMKHSDLDVNAKTRVGLVSFSFP